MPSRIGSIVATMGERHARNFSAKRHRNGPSARVATRCIVDANFRKEVGRFEMHASLFFQLPRSSLYCPLPFIDEAARESPSTCERFIAPLDKQDDTVAVGIVGNYYGVCRQSRTWILIGEHF